MKSHPPLKTPDGRYLIVRGRLWRTSNPHLSEQQRTELVAELMAARSRVRLALQSGDAVELQAAHAGVHAAKVALGERGPVWWDDAPDLNRRLVKNTPYADWYDTTGDGDADR